MRQVLQSRGGETVVRDVPAPACDPGGLLVQTLYSVISSGTERANVESSQQSLLARARARPDLVRSVLTRARNDGIGATRKAIAGKLAEERAVGYSSAGRVIEVGEHARGFSPGDLVACAGAGHANHAEIVSVPANLCVSVPDAIPPEVAALTTVGAIALQGIRLSEAVLGERVAVVGCGLVGQITCRLLASAGIEVFAVDLDERRCQLARDGGADRALVVSPTVADDLRALTGGIGVDHSLVTAGSKSSTALVLATEIARDRGTVVLVGDVPLELPRAPMYRKELVLRVSRSYGPGRYDPEYEERGLDYPVGYVRWSEQRNMQAVLDLQARGRLRLDDIVEDVVPVERAGDAYARLLLAPAERPLGAIVLSYGAPVSEPAPRRLSVDPGTVSGKRPPGRSPSPIRIGLIGPGAFATRVLVPALQAGGAVLQAVGGGSGPSARAAQQLGFARVAATESDVFQADDVDAVVIATRHGSHARLCVEALRARKHVFCEKPLALTEADLRLVLEAAENSDRVLAVGFNRRFSPGFKQLREFVYTPGRRLTGIYRVSAGHVPPGEWVHDLSQGGGRALGEACHFIDTLAALAGSPVARVFATGYAQEQLPIQASDNLAITLAFADGSLGGIAYVADGSPQVPKERLECFSGKRTAVLDDYRMLDLHDTSNQRVDLGRSGKGHREEIGAFLAAVGTGSPFVPLAEIANVSIATLAIIESLRTGLPVVLG